MKVVRPSSSAMFVLQDDVEKFHIATGVPVLYSPAVPPLGRVDLRQRLIHEEVVNELFPLLEFSSRTFVDESKWLAEVADGIADSIYVLLGTAAEFGIPMDQVWAAVQEANMAKLWPDGKARHREDGKVLKPPGWTPPDIEGIIKEAMK